MGPCTPVEDLAKAPGYSLVHPWLFPPSGQRSFLAGRPQLGHTASASPLPHSRITYRSPWRAQVTFPPNSVRGGDTSVLCPSPNVLSRELSRVPVPGLAAPPVLLLAPACSEITNIPSPNSCPDFGETLAEALPSRSSAPALTLIRCEKEEARERTEGHPPQQQTGGTESRSPRLAHWSFHSRCRRAQHLAQATTCEHQNAVWVCTMCPPF